MSRLRETTKQPVGRPKNITNEPELRAPNLYESEMHIRNTQKILSNSNGVAMPSQSVLG